MDEVDGWSVLGARYESDALQEFAEFVDQIELALQLLDEGSRSRARTALTELHSLADILLFRRAQLVFRVTEGSTWHHHALTFTRPERRDLERSFLNRVSLATEDISGVFVHPLDPLLDAADAEVFRIAHAYRNPAYHKGEQNEATLPLITRIFLVAVTRAWSKSQPPIGVERQRWNGLRGRRLAAVNDDAGFVRLDHAAATIAAELGAEAAVEAPLVRETLADDLLLRVAAVRDMLSDLERDGLTRNRVAESLAWAEMFDQLEAERDVIDLELRRRDVARELASAVEEGKRPPMRLQRVHAELQEAHASRVFSTWRTFRPKLSLQTVDRIPKRVAELRKLKTPAAILRRYRQLDEQMEAVERHLWVIARGWDEYLDSETERLRGN